MIHPGKLCFPGCFLFAAPRRGTPNSQKKTSAFPEAGKALVLLFAWYLLPQGASDRLRAFAPLIAGIPFENNLRDALKRVIFDLDIAVRNCD